MFGPFYFPSLWFQELVPRHPQVEPYRYWDTPDYEDTHKKIMIAAKYGFWTGFAYSLADVFAVNRNPSYLKSVGRLLGNIGRIGGTFVLASAMTHSVANIRHKDDEYNWIIGGATSGLIWGFKTRSTAIGAGTCAALGFLGWMIKRGEKENWEILPRRDWDETGLQNGALGGQKFGDWRMQWLRPSHRVDPGDHCRYVD